MAELVAFEGVWGQPFEELPAGIGVERLADNDLGGVSEPARVRAVLVRNRTQVTAEFLESLPALEIVARAGVGLDNIDVAAADRRGVVVSSPRGANAVSVAEHALGLALAVARRITQLDRDTRAGGWQRTPGVELAGGVWGLLGAGATGLACARLARGLDMQVLAHDPYADPAELRAAGIEPVSLTELVRRSGVLSCQLPATDATRGLIDAELLAQLPAGAILVNVGRGEAIDEAALIDALRSGRLAGAGLDVRATEPPVPGELESLPTVVLTPHVAGITTQSQHRIMAALAGDVARVLTGHDPRCAVGAVRTGKARA